MLFVFCAAGSRLEPGRGWFVLTEASGLGEGSGVYPAVDRGPGSGDALQVVGVLGLAELVDRSDLSLAAFAGLRAGAVRAGVVCAAGVVDDVADLRRPLLRRLRRLCGRFLDVRLVYPAVDGRAASADVYEVVGVLAFAELVDRGDLGLAGLASGPARGVRVRVVLAAGEGDDVADLQRLSGALRGSGSGVRRRARRFEQRSHVGADCCHGLAMLREPVVHVSVVRAEAQLVAVCVAEDRRNVDAVDLDRAVRINAEKLAEVGRDLAGLLVDLFEVCGIGQTVLADLELDPAVVAGAFAAASAAPRLEVPRHRLNGGDSSVGQLSDPAVQTGLTRDVVPVVPVGVLADQGDHLGLVGGVVVGLDVALQVGVIGPGAMPEHALDCHLLGALVACALCHETLDGLVCVAVLHGVPPLSEAEPPPSDGSVACGD